MKMKPRQFKSVLLSLLLLPLLGCVGSTQVKTIESPAVSPSVAPAVAITPEPTPISFASPPAAPVKTTAPTGKVKLRYGDQKTRCTLPMPSGERVTRLKSVQPGDSEITVKAKLVDQADNEGVPSLNGDYAAYLWTSEASGITTEIKVVLQADSVVERAFATAQDDKVCAWTVL